MTELDTLLSNEKTKYEKQREDAQASLDEANRYLKAIAAFDAAKEGKTPAPNGADEAPKQKAPRAPRGSGDSAKAQVLAFIREHPDGIPSDEIKKAFPGMTSLGNILSQLKVKDKAIIQEGRGNPYFPAEAA